MCARFQFKGLSVHLQKGALIAVPNRTGGKIHGRFAGYMRKEKWEWWKPRTKAIHVVPVLSFGERDRRGQIHDFAVPAGKAAIMAEVEAYDGRPGLVVATQAATGNVAQIHYRMPVIVDETFQPKFK